MAKAEREISCYAQHLRATTDIVIGMYLFESKYGHATPEEARKVLSKFGQLKSCYSATTLECNALFLNEGGVLVSFKMYDMGQAAMQVR